MQTQNKISALKIQIDELTDKLSKAKADLAFFEKNIDIYENVMELSRNELDHANRTIDAFIQVQELSRNELLTIKENLSVLKIKDPVNTDDIHIILQEDLKNEKKLLDQFAILNMKESENKYVDLFKTLINFEFSKEEAQSYWEAILDHLKEMCIALKRNVGFRVALLDFFINVNKKLENPKIIELKVYEETMEQAIYDELTTVYNRNYFQKYSRSEFARSARYGKQLTYILLDIDDFKKYNDTYGHELGDKILKEFGILLKESCREEDVVCRYGGEEFLVICPETGSEGALATVKRVYQLLNKKKLPFSFSGGIASYPLNAMTKEELFKKTDTALYEAKRTGKNKALIYQSNFLKI